MRNLRFQRKYLFYKRGRHCRSGNNYSAPVVTIGCFFMKKPAPTNNSGDEGVIAEFRPNCLVNNASFGQTPSDSGAYKIQLYKDPLGSGA